MDMKFLIITACFAVMTVVIFALIGILRREDVKLVFYSRVPLLAAIGLSLIGPIAIFSPLKHLLGNAFLAYGFLQLTLTSAVCILTGFLVAAIYRNIEYNGRERFLGIPFDLEKAQRLTNESGTSDPANTTDERLAERDAESADFRTASGNRWFQVAKALVDFLRSVFFEEPTAPKCWGRLRNVWHVIFALFIMGFSSPICVLIYSIEQNAWTSGWTSGFIAMSVGCVMAFGFLLLATFLANKFAPTTLQIPGMYGIEMSRLFGKTLPNESALRFGRLWARLTQGPGYASKGPEQPDSYITHPGHFQMTISTAVLALLYLIVFWWSSSVAPQAKSENALPTVAYVVFVVGFVTCIVAFAAFLLDYYHAPSTLVTAAFLILIYSLPTHTPASFQPVLSKTGRISPPKLSEILSKRIEIAHQNWPSTERESGSPGRRERVLIVVTAPGGGIHAAAWTARVLTGLHERYGEPFDDSLGVISGISGGGMGAWVYVDAMARGKEDSILDVNKIAQASSLDAVAWGLAFPDLVRSVNPLPWSPDDRGRVLENTWDARLENWDPINSMSRCRTLGDLAARAKEGKIPVMAWTTTDVVTGKRVVIAPIADGVGATETTINLYNELNQLGGKDYSFDLQAATATRLAATFPYVTPIVGLDRNVMGTEKYESKELLRKVNMLSQLRCIDGGYFDNEGLVTAVNCVATFLKDLVTGDGPPRPIDRIILLRIEPSPSAPSDPTEAIEAVNRSGLDLVMSALGPIIALANVRSASQAERGNLEAYLLVHASIERAAHAKKTATELEEQLKANGLSREDLEQLWSSDWKTQLFSTESKGKAREKSHQMLSAAIKYGLSDKKAASKSGDEPPRSASIAEGATQALEWWKSNSITLEHSVEDLSKHLGQFNSEMLGEQLKNNVYPILEDLRGKSREEEVRQITVEQISIPFKNSDKLPPPLSWALSPKEKAKYDKAWNSLKDAADSKAEDKSPLTFLDTIFVRQLLKTTP